MGSSTMSTTISLSGAPVTFNGASGTPIRPSQATGRSARRRTRANGSREADIAGGDGPVQLSLMLVVPPMGTRTAPALPEPKRLGAMDRFAGMDARMSTSDVVRVVGVNRSTLFRWCKKGTFPTKHVSGGWLRSDIERWFATKAGQNA